MYIENHGGSLDLLSHSGLCDYCNKLNLEKLRLPLASEVGILSRLSWGLGGSKSDASLIDSRLLTREEEDV